MTTGNELNLAFGKIEPLETTMGSDSTSSGIVRLPTEPFSQSNVSST